MGADNIEVEFTAQSFLHYLHVEETKEAAAEAEAEGDGAFGVKGEGGVVKVEFLQAVANFLIFVGTDGVDTTEDHGADFFVAGEGFIGAGGDGGDGVAAFYILSVTQGADNIADLPLFQY